VVQVLVFDNLGFGIYIHPYIYVLFVLLLPFDTPKWRLLIDGFLIGIAVDIFNGTPGLNAGATVFLAFMRPYIIGITSRKSDLDGKNAPTVTEMGLQWFAVYAFLLILLHNLVLFWLEAFSIKLFGLVIAETLLSAPVTLLLLILIIYIFKPLKK
jgi:hypothetical protein